jgi:hypothetical protein
MEPTANDLLKKAGTLLLYRATTGGSRCCFTGINQETHRSYKKQKTSYKTATIGSTHNKDRALRSMALTRRLTNAKEGTKTSGGECVNSFSKMEEEGRRKN